MIADMDDLAARLWREYLSIYDRLEALTAPDDAGYDAEISDLIERARNVMADLSFAKPVTPLGAVASLFAAKHFAAEALDTSDAAARANLHRAAERCIEAAVAVLEAHAPVGRAQMVNS